MRPSAQNPASHGGLHCLAARPMARVRLICAPHAGAGPSAYRGFAAALPGWIEPYALAPPGRESAAGAPPLSRWADIVAFFEAAIDRMPPGPLALFGHSFGAELVFDCARRIERRAPGRLAHLFVSARPWPGDVDRAGLRPPAAMADDALLDALEARFGPAPAALAHPEIRAATLPALRADLAALSDFVFEPGAPLPCGATVFIGDADPSTGGFDPTRWAQATSRAPRVVRFADGHYFLQDRRAEICAAIVADLGAFADA